MIQVIKNPSTQICTYGTYTPLQFDTKNGRFRHDVYKSKSTGEESIESVLVLDTNDKSPVKIDSSYNDRLNCHCCFTGYAHSVNLCNDRQKKA